MKNTSSLVTSVVIFVVVSLWCFAGYKTHQQRTANDILEQKINQRGTILIGSSCKVAVADTSRTYRIIKIITSQYKMADGILFEKNEKVKLDRFIRRSEAEIKLPEWAKTTGCDIQK